MIVSRTQSRQNFGMAVKVPKKIPILEKLFLRRALKDEADKVNITVKTSKRLQEFSLMPPKLKIESIYKVFVSHLEDKTINTAFSLSRNGARAKELKSNVINALDYIQAVRAQKVKWG